MGAESTDPKQHGRPWPKGTSGNPNGRPRGSRHKALVALDGIGAEHAKGIMEAVIQAAQGGDMRAAEILLRRLWPERKGRPVLVEVPEINNASDVQAALASIATAACGGEITPEEASTLAAVIDAQRRAIETMEFDARLRALEERIEGNEQGD